MVIITLNGSSIWDASSEAAIGISVIHRVQGPDQSHYDAMSMVSGTWNIHAAASSSDASSQEKMKKAPLGYQFSIVSGILVKCLS
jgi:hypothetical protein